MGTLNKNYLAEFAKGLTFIETGTYEGDTVQLAKEFGFEHIHSIELNEDLHKKCAKRFENDTNIKIWQGDSVDRLRDIMKEVKGQATFWLDAHASGPLPGGKYGGSPLVHEIKAIGEHETKNHIIFIDDCRLFGSGEWDGLDKNDVIDALLEINHKYRVTYLDGTVHSDIMVARVTG
jgi:hypothetical protein